MITPLPLRRKALPLRDSEDDVWRRAQMVFKKIEVKEKV